MSSRLFTGCRNTAQSHQVTGEAARHAPSLEHPLKGSGTPFSSHSYGLATEGGRPVEKLQMLYPWTEGQDLRSHPAGLSLRAM